MACLPMSVARVDMRPLNVLDLLSDRSGAATHVQLYVRKPRVWPNAKHRDKVAISPDCISMIELEEHIAGLKADLDLALVKARAIFEALDASHDHHHNA